METDLPPTTSESFGRSCGSAGEAPSTAIGFVPDPIEAAIENDPTLVPAGPSKLLVEPAVLDEQEVQALLCGLSQALQTAADHAATAIVANAQKSDEADHEEHAYESHPSTTRRDRGYPKLSPLAWLFADDAGIGRSAGHQQGDHLRARRRVGKKARPASRQAQGSLFGDRVG